MDFRAWVRSLIALATLLACSPTQAQLFRAYLAVDGSDANPCTLASPCRLLPAALAAVASGGEVWMLDSANYNAAPVTIGKSVTIVAIPGAIGSVLSRDYESAITISAPDLKVTLRNLVIGPLPGGTSWQGVDLLAASTLIIENCVIANLAYSGVRATLGKVEIIDTIIRNNSGYGIQLQDGTSAQITRTRVLKNLAGGIFAWTYNASNVRATVSDSVVTGSASGSDAGIHAKSMPVGGDVRVYLIRTSVQESRYALRSETTVGGSALISMSYSLIANNDYGWYVAGAGAMIRTLGNNHIADGSFSGSLTSTALQ